MIIKNGLVFTKNGFKAKDLYIKNGNFCAVPTSRAYPENSHTSPIHTEAHTNCGKIIKEIATETTEEVIPRKETPSVEMISEEEIIDATDLYVIPGLTDIHFHGCMGQDFSSGTLDALTTISKYQASQGITTICPATMTLPTEQLTRVCEVAASYASQQGEVATTHRSQHDDVTATHANQHGEVAATHGRQHSENSHGAILCGINLEGPFLSEEKKGAQNATFLQSADLDKFQSWQKAANGLIKLISIAPEFPENMAFIRRAKNSITVSLAHTNADYETAMEAFEAGASHVTHLFNGMSPLAHRNPGVPGAAHDSKHVTVELICDGIHLHPAMIRTAFSIYGADRIVLVSDSIEATGMPDGTYQLGGQEVNVRGKLATLTNTTTTDSEPIAGSVTTVSETIAGSITTTSKTIAGSVTNLMDCVRYLVTEVGIPLTTAIQCAAVNPAKSIGIYDKYGSLDVGKVANFVLLDKELNLKGVYIRGKQFLD